MEKVRECGSLLFWECEPRLDIGQHNAMEIFALKWNIVSETSKVLLNDIFTELDGSSGIKNIITDRLNLGELQVHDISAKIRYGRK